MTTNLHKYIDKIEKCVHKTIMTLIIHYIRMHSLNGKKKVFMIHINRYENP